MRDNSFIALAREFTDDLFHCSRCNYCVEMIWEERGIHHVCPTLLHHNPAPSYSGKGYLAIARALADGEEISQSALVDRLFACTTCGNCEQVCPIGLKPAQLVRALRADLVANAMAPPEVLALADRIAVTQNPSGLSRSERYRWRESTDYEPDGPSNILYLPGCSACYGMAGEAAATLRVLTKIGFALRTLSAEQDRCCGAVLFEIGHLEMARHQGRSTLDLIETSGASQIVTSSAECLEALRHHYPSRLGRESKVPVVHALELLHERLASRKLNSRWVARPSAPGTVALMDSCHLSKKSHGPLGEAGYPRIAREILASLGCRVFPDETAAAYAVCCGAAGGMPQLHPESSLRMARAKLDELVQTGAEAIVCPSPLCAGQLRQANQSIAPVYGLFEFIDTFFESTEGGA